MVNASDASQSTSSAPPTPTANQAPRFSELTWSAARPTTLAAMPRPASARRAFQRGRRGSTSRRSVASGEMSRTRSSGSIAKIIAVQTPSADAGEQGGHRRHDVDIHRDEIGEDDRHQLLQPHAQRGAKDRPEQPHRQRLQQVDAEDLPGGRPEAAEHRDAVELLTDEDVNRAGDTEPAEQERCQRHEPEVVAKSVSPRVSASRSSATVRKLTRAACSAGRFALANACALSVAGSWSR